MAVIFVIGLSLGMVGLSVSGGGPKDDIWNTIEKFMGMAQFANEKAILSGDAVGLIIQPPSWQAERGQDINDIGWRFRWVLSSPQGWQEIPNLEAISLPPTLRLVVELDEELWRYDTQLDRDTPIVAFYPSGDVTYFSIEFTDERDSSFTQHIKVDETGQLVWVEAPEPPKGDKNGF